MDTIISISVTQTDQVTPFLVGSSYERTYFITLGASCS